MLVIRKITRLRFDWLVVSSVTFFTFFYLLLLSLIDSSPPENDTLLLPPFSIISKAVMKPTRTSSSAHRAMLNTFPQIQSPNLDRNASRPWLGDPTCEHFTVKFADDGSIPKWALTSIPGSGVTWTRQIIEGVTGIYSGSIYFRDPPPVKLTGNQIVINTDDVFCDCTLLHKDHEATEALDGIEDYLRMLYLGEKGEEIRNTYNYRGVLLLRNPMDVVFTFRNWQVTGNKTAKASPKSFQGRQWDEIVEYVAFAWADHAIRWIEQIKQGTVIFYENLLGPNASIEIERLMKAIHFSPVDPERVRCALAHRSRTDHKRVNKTWMPLKKSHRLKLLDSIHRVQQSLLRRNWPALPVSLYDFHNADNVEETLI